jgi:hypothetical protein
MVRGEEVADQWIKYFDGDWKRESKLWTANDGWTEETETWTGELVAGGITNVSKGTSSWGDFMTVFAIEGHSGKLFEYGSAATRLARHLVGRVETHIQASHRLFGHPCEFPTDVYTLTIAGHSLRFPFGIVFVNRRYIESRCHITSIWQLCVVRAKSKILLRFGRDPCVQLGA